MERDQGMQREAITLPEPSSPRGSYSTPGFYVVDQTGTPLSDRYDTQALAYANLRGGAGVQYLDQPEQGHLNQPWPPELHTVVGHTQGGQMYSEADILRAMASTSDLDEQRYLMAALHEVRQEAHQIRAGGGQVDMAPPNHVGEERPFYPYHVGAFGTSSATDWLGDLRASDEGMAEHMLTMGSRFFIGCHPEVKADPVEYMTQALGVARVAASQFANIEQAVGIFMDHVANLARVDMTKIAVDQLLPWEAPPEQLPPTDSDYTDSPYSPNQNTEVEPYSGSESLPGLDNGASGRAVQGSFPGILSSHQHMSEYLFDPPTPEELAAASGPGNLNQQFGASATSEDESAGSFEESSGGPGYSATGSLQRRAEDTGEKDDPEGDYKYVKHREGHKDSEGNDAPWVVVQKDTGKILSSHPSRADAIDGFKAMMRGKHGGSLKCACVEHKGNFVLRDGRKVTSYIDRRQCPQHNGSRALSPDPTTYEEYLARLAPGSAGVSREFFSGAMAAHSPSDRDPSVPEWGRRTSPKDSVTGRPRPYPRGVTPIGQENTRTAASPSQLQSLMRHLKTKHPEHQRVAGSKAGDINEVMDNARASHEADHEQGTYVPHSHSSGRSQPRTAANEDMLNPQAFERADESDAPSLRGSDGTGTYDQEDTWLQSGEAAHEPSGLIPQTDLSEGFSNISDFPDTGDAEVPSTRARNVEGAKTAMKWSPASGMAGRGMGAGDPYGDFTPTHTYNPIGWDMFDARPHPGSNPIAAGSEVQLHGKMDPSGLLVHIRDEDGNHQTVDRRSLDKHGPHREASLHLAADDDDDDQRPGFEVGGPENKPGAYEPDRTLYSESPQGEEDATEGYEEAYSSGRMIDWTGSGADVLGTVPVQGYDQNAERPNGEMFTWVQEPIGSPPRGAADVADVPTPGMIAADQTGSSYPQPNVKESARLDAWRANIAARMPKLAEGGPLNHPARMSPDEFLDHMSAHHGWDPGMTASYRDNQFNLEPLEKSHNIDHDLGDVPDHEHERIPGLFRSVGIVGTRRPAWQEEEPREPRPVHDPNQMALFAGRRTARPFVGVTIDRGPRRYRGDEWRQERAGIIGPADPEDEDAVQRHMMSDWDLHRTSNEGRLLYDSGEPADGAFYVTKHGPGHYSFTGDTGEHHFGPDAPRN